ncbi:hypothetical protein Tco_0537085 [Tanacetum coccineum]
MKIGFIHFTLLAGKAAQYLDFGLEELVPSLWIESEREYDISVAYGISHWWFEHKEFYITRHSAPSDCSTVRSHMRILSCCLSTVFDKFRPPPPEFVVVETEDVDYCSFPDIVSVGLTCGGHVVMLPLLKQLHEVGAE